MRSSAEPIHRTSLGRGVGLLMVALVAMGVIVALLAWRARATLDDLRRADRINNVLPSMTTLMEDLLNAETGQRGYLLTQRSSYLQPYRDAVRNLDRRVEELGARDQDPAHAPKLARVRELVNLKLGEMNQTIRLHDSGRQDEALELVLNDQGLHHMDELRDVLGELTSSLRAERAAISERLSREALAAGHEGVLVKAVDSPYTAGRRGKSWVKVKPVLTFDLVVLGAEWGSGRRRGWLSNLHLGARDPDGEFGEPGGYVMVGKTFKGLTDELLRWQTETFPEYEESRSAYAMMLRPEIVVEIAIDGVQRSPRYPGGIALRFARVKGYRPDKTAAEADTIQTLRALLRG